MFLTSKYVGLGQRCNKINEFLCKLIRSNFEKFLTIRNLSTVIFLSGILELQF